MIRRFHTQLALRRGKCLLDLHLILFLATATQSTSPLSVDKAVGSREVVVVSRLPFLFLYLRVSTVQTVAALPPVPNSPILHTLIAAVDAPFRLSTLSSTA